MGILKMADEGESRQQTTGKTETVSSGSGDDDESDDHEGEYDVEKIVGMRKSKSKTLYKVRWYGYGSDDDTWETIDNLASCTDMVKEFVENRKRQMKEKDNTGALLSSDDSSNDSKMCKKRKPTYFYVSNDEEKADHLRD